MAEDYLTADDIKAALPDGSWGTAYDTELARLATAASRAIDRFTGREDGAYKVTADTTRLFTPPLARGHVEPDLGHLFLPLPASLALWVGELAAAPTSVAMTVTTPRGVYTTLAATDYYPEPANALLEGRPYTRLVLDRYNGAYMQWYPWPLAVKVVGRFGYSTEPPGEIVEATLIQAVRWFKRGQQAFQDTGAVSELAQLRYVKRLDPDIEAILERGGYVRTAV